MGHTDPEPPAPPGPRCEVSIGDVIRAFGMLAPQTDRLAIVRALGYDVEADDSGSDTRPPASEPEEHDDDEVTPDQSMDRPTPTVTRTTPELEELEAIGSVRRRAPVLAADAPEFETEKPEHHEPPARHLSLYRDDWTTSIVQAALQTPAPGDEIDVDALVDTVAHARPIVELPRLPRPSLFRGVQLLIDIAEGMEPFRRDQRELAEAIDDVVGTEAVDRRYFRGSPADGAGPGPVWMWKHYEPPDHGRPVLVLSDLGIGGPPMGSHFTDDDEWIRLAHRLERRGSRLIAFVPYPAERWPRTMADVVSMFEWDRNTGSADIRQTLGRIGR